MAGEAFGLVRSTGIKARVDGTMMPPAFPDDPPPGVHEWALMATYRISDPTQRDEVMLDVENLVGVSPPMCIGCVQIYTPTVAARPCPGDPDA